jgi:tRNA G18 (ribose-2'-O)-methylase SpoU
VKKKILILHNIRSAYNVGAILRTADAIAIDRVYLTGYTPLPVNKFGLPDKQVAKTALGAEQVISWEHVLEVAILIEQLKRQGVFVVGLELDSSSVDYKTNIPKQDIAILLGEEVGGIHPELRVQCDLLVQIPMHGVKESLNVSVAAGILLYRLFDH